MLIDLSKLTREHAMWGKDIEMTAGEEFTHKEPDTDDPDNDEFVADIGIEEYEDDLIIKALQANKII